MKSKNGVFPKVPPGLFLTFCCNYETGGSDFILFARHPVWSSHLRTFSADRSLQSPSIGMKPSIPVNLVAVCIGNDTAAAHFVRNPQNNLERL